MATRSLTTISLYTGVGGLDFGFEAAGFRTAVAVELDPVACSTVRRNRPEWSLIERDIHEVSSQEILRAGRLKVGQADVLIGGPPCQPFSKSSYWVAGDALRLDDPRADTLTAYLRVLRDTKPRAFLLENVYGLVYKGKDEGLRHLLDGVARINREAGTNYQVSWKLLNAARYGVPQIRERVFLIGSRDGGSFEFPLPTHDPRATWSSSTATSRTARRGTRSATCQRIRTIRRWKSAGSGERCFRPFPRARTTSGTRTAAAGFACSGGGPATGASCSSSRRASRHGRSRRSQARRSARSTGAAGSSRPGRCAACRRSRTT